MANEHHHHLFTQKVKTGKIIYNKALYALIFAHEKYNTDNKTLKTAKLSETKA